MTLLGDEENKRAMAFADKHYKKHKKTLQVTVEVTATGIGFHVQVCCPYCKKCEDISDYDSW